MVSHVDAWTPQVGVQRVDVGAVLRGWSGATEGANAWEAGKVLEKGTVCTEGGSSILKRADGV